MFSTNLKIAWRNLVKNGIYSFSNIGGLAVGVTAFLLTMLYETHLAHYDAWDPGFDGIYQLQHYFPDEGNGRAYMSPLLMPVLNKDIPEIEASTRVTFGNGGTLLRIGEQKYYEKHIVNVDSSFFEVFPFQLKRGDRKTALRDPNSVIISEELAEKYFRNKDPMGQVIRYDERKDYVVTGILAKPGGPTQIKINALMRIKVPDWAGWGNFQYWNYVRLRGKPELTHLGEKMTMSFMKAGYDEMKIWSGWPPTLAAYMAKKDHSRLDLVPISTIFVKQHKKILVVLSSLSIIILIVACINFINQVIASADSRAKEIGVRKAMGGLRGGLARQFMLETFLQCFFALFLSLILVELLMPYYNRLTEETIPFLSYCAQPAFLLKLAGTLVVVTILSGLYPAFYLSAFLPAQVLKGNFERGTGGQLLRKILLCLQFVFSLGFVICLMIINRQTEYMQTIKPGFAVDAVSSVIIQEMKTLTDYQVIRQRLKTIPHVNNAALTDYLPWTNGSNNDMVRYGGTNLNIQRISVTSDYFATLGVPVVEGREFSATIPGDTLASVVINEAAVKSYNIPEPVVGKTIDLIQDVNSFKSYKIVGVVKDFMLDDFSNPIRPTIFMDNPNGSYIMVFNVDPHYYGETMKKIEDAWREIEPAHPMVAGGTRDNLNQVTAQYLRLQRIVSLFAYVTIVIATIGLLSLVAYNLKRRMKEIGIRKVVGASLRDVLTLVNKEFIYILLLANLLAWIMAYLLMSAFLKEFVFRIGMPYGLFPMVTLVSLCVTVILVSGRVWRAVRTTPAEVLKYE